MSFLARIFARIGRGRVDAADRGMDHPEGQATADRHSTTGTTENGTFVGQASGEDAGYLETGAERRGTNAGSSPADDPEDRSRPENGETQNR